jgi:hypothetical protein
VNPIKTLRDAATLPFTAIFVVGIWAFINWTTTPGHWWVQWVILGMGIAVISAWARAIKLLIAAGALATLGAFVLRALGGEPRAAPPPWRDRTG